MKKTLAILLAMLMILSVALIACGKNENEEDTSDSSDDLGGFVIQTNDDSDGDGSEDGSDNDKEGNSNSSGFAPITENTERYMLMSVNVRTNYKKSATNGAAMYGSKVVCVETNDTWTKIKYTDANGATKEGYVRNEVLTIDAGRVTYVAKEAPVKATSTSDRVSVRKTPWVAIEEYSNLIDQIIGNNGDAYKLRKGQEVELLGTTQSPDGVNLWGYIKYTVGEETIHGWCRMDFLSTGETTDAPAADPSTPGVPSPV